MKNIFIRLVKLGAIIALGVALVVPAAGQTVMVTFQANTATNLDTLGESGVVQIRGALLAGDGMTTREGDILPGGGNISWSSGSSLILDNIGGDYWQGTFEMNANDTLTYKFWTGFDLDNGTVPDGGWEGAFEFSQGLERDTRIFIIGDSDTTVALQYYHPGGGSPAVDQFFRPFETKPDTLSIYFRVNLGGITEGGLFDPAVNGPAGVRGSPETSGGAIDWGETRVLLTREENSVDNGSFWSGVAYVPTDSVEAGSTQKYKFFIENNGGIDWEGSVNPDDIDGNRTFDYTATLLATMDTTLQWVYFNNQAPTGKELIDSQVTFRVNLQALEDIGLFDRGVGDKVAVIGAKGWDVPGDFIDMTFIPALQEWAVAEPFTALPGAEIPYKYFIVWDSSRVDNTSDNFIPGLDLSNGWSEPGITGGGNRILVFQNAPQQSPEGDFGQDLQFYNGVPPNAVITTPITVTWNINMTPATDAATNTNPLFRPGTDSVFVQMDGSLLAVTQGLPNGGADSRIVKLVDPDGDGIYSGSFAFNPPIWYQLGFIIAYSSDTGYITNGGGFDRGRRYYQYIRPDNVNQDGTVDWPSTFDLPVLDWKESNLDVEDPPDLTGPTSVAGHDEGIPNSFALFQNYPNPFNPETTIRYEVANTSNVKIQVYNLVGQLVKTLVDQKQNAGNYTIKWNGDNNHGQIVSSGVYFLKMKAGDFTKVRKMAFIR